MTDETAARPDPAPEVLPGETGAQYTNRMRDLRGESLPAGADTTPLTGVSASEDPLGISTGRAEKEADGSVTEAQPGILSDLEGAERDADVRTDRDEGDEDLEAEGEDATSKKGKLPEDFPGRAALEAEGITSYGAARKARDKGTLTEIAGIGEATAAKIEAEL